MPILGNDRLDCCSETPRRLDCGVPWTHATSCEAPREPLHVSRLCDIGQYRAVCYVLISVVVGCSHSSGCCPVDKECLPPRKGDNSCVLFRPFTSINSPLALLHSSFGISHNVVQDPRPYRQSSQAPPRDLLPGHHRQWRRLLLRCCRHGRSHWQVDRR